MIRRLILALILTVSPVWVSARAGEPLQVIGRESMRAGPWSVVLERRLAPDHIEHRITIFRADDPSHPVYSGVLGYAAPCWPVAGGLHMARASGFGVVYACGFQIAGDTPISGFSVDAHLYAIGQDGKPVLDPDASRRWRAFLAGSGCLLGDLSCLESTLDQWEQAQAGGGK